MVFNGTVGARLHVAFPVLNRSSFGFGFSYFTVVSRVVLACFWFGVQVCYLQCLIVFHTERGIRRIQGLNVFFR